MNEKVDNACIPKKSLFRTIRSALVFNKIPGKLQKKKNGKEMVIIVSLIVNFLIFFHEIATPL